VLKWLSSSVEKSCLCEKDGRRDAVYTAAPYMACVD